MLSNFMSANLSPTLLTAFASCALIQLIAWLWQVKTKNADSVDIAWSLSMVVATLVFYFKAPDSNPTRHLILLFPGLWYLRLSRYLLKRYRVNHEDNRYKYLRNHWQKYTQIKFFGFFLFQALLAVLFALPAYWISLYEITNLKLMICGILIGVIALIGVTVADKQLFEFKDNPLNKKEVCNVGLWQYSRHPNYFFEWLHWFVYPLFLWSSPYFYPSIAITLLMLFFLLYLTGIPFSEQQSLINRGDKYREYQSRTSKFFPWKPKKA